MTHTKEAIETRLANCRIQIAVCSECLKKQEPCAIDFSGALLGLADWLLMEMILMEDLAALDGKQVFTYSI